MAVFPFRSITSFFCFILVLALLPACGKKQEESVSEPSSMASVSTVNAAGTTASEREESKDTPDSFIENLQVTLKAYDELSLRQLVDAFNARQLQLHGIEEGGEDLPPLPEGVVQIDFEDLGEHVVLHLREVLTAHSKDIDAGVDQFRSVFLRKGDMKKLTDIASRSHAIPDTSMRIAIGSQQSCMGDAPGDGYAIFDLKQNGKIYLAEKFQDQAQSFEIKHVNPGIIQLTTHSETAFKGKEKDSQQCEIGGWVDVLETSYTISCDAKAGKCTSQKKQRSFAACSDAGACD